jgi:hypothetical protein
MDQTGRPDIWQATREKYPSKDITKNKAFY